MIGIRRAGTDDAQGIGAMFDAAVREGWKYLGELAARPMFPPQEWDTLVAEHAPPNALLVAIDEADRSDRLRCRNAPPRAKCTCCSFTPITVAAA